MKFIVLAFFTTLLSLLLQAQNEEGFTITTEEARKLGKNSKTVLDSEFGDSDGPFKWVAGANVYSRDHPGFRVMFGGGAISHFSQTKNPFVELEVNFFLNEKGNVFGVLHRRGAHGDTLPELEEPDPLPRENVSLSDAAMFALVEGKLELLDSILKAGLKINRPIQGKSGNTVLSLAAMCGDAKSVKFLLDRGADPRIRDSFGLRPIDSAWENPKVAEVLRLPEQPEKLIAGHPIGVVEEAFFKQRDKKFTGALFLSFNGQAPEPGVLALAKKCWPKAKIYPKSEMASGRSSDPKKHGIRSSFLHKESGEFGPLYELSLKKKGENEYQWTHRIATGNFLAGGGMSGIVFRKYGYWISKMTLSWDE